MHPDEQIEAAQPPVRFRLFAIVSQGHRCPYPDDLALSQSRTILKIIRWMRTIMTLPRFGFEQVSGERVDLEPLEQESCEHQ